MEHSSCNTAHNTYTHNVHNTYNTHIILLMAAAKCEVNLAIDSYYDIYETNVMAKKKMGQI